MGLSVSVSCDGVTSTVNTDDDFRVESNEVADAFLSSESRDIFKSEFELLVFGRKKTHWQLGCLTCPQEEGQMSGHFLMILHCEFVEPGLSGILWVKCLFTLTNNKGFEYETYFAEMSKRPDADTCSIIMDDFISPETIKKLQDLKSGERLMIRCDFETRRGASVFIEGAVARMLDKQIFQDLTLVSTIDREEHKCHRALLAAHSPVFQAALENDKKAERLELELKGSSIRAIVVYLYKGCMCNNPSVALDLFQTAAKHQILGLVQLCLDVMIDDISTENFGQVLIMVPIHVTVRTIELESNRLNNACCNFFTKNCEEIYASSSWKKLEEEKPELTYQFLKQCFAWKKKKEMTIEE